jgi:hypothetical protein
MARTDESGPLGVNEMGCGCVESRPTRREDAKAVADALSRDSGSSLNVIQAAHRVAAHAIRTMCTPMVVWFSEYTVIPHCCVYTRMDFPSLN